MFQRRQKKNSVNNSVVLKLKEPPKKEGEISIDKMPKTKESNKDVGDYVDYEEID